MARQKTSHFRPREAYFTPPGNVANPKAPSISRHGPVCRASGPGKPGICTLRQTGRRRCVPITPQLLDLGLRRFG
jgi:hypothetical protein